MLTQVYLKKQVTKVKKTLSSTTSSDDAVSNADTPVSVSSNINDEDETNLGDDEPKSTIAERAARFFKGKKIKN